MNCTRCNTPCPPHEVPDGMCVQCWKATAEEYKATLTDLWLKQVRENNVLRTKLLYAVRAARKHKERAAFYKDSIWPPLAEI